MCLIHTYRLRFLFLLDPIEGENVFPDQKPCAPRTGGIEPVHSPGPWFRAVLLEIIGNTVILERLI